MSRYHTYLNDRRWAIVRRAAFERDGYRCVMCGRARRLRCDHILPLQLGGDPWDMENLQTLCRACHIRKTAGENRRELTFTEEAWNQLVAELWNEFEEDLYRRHNL